MIPQMEQGRSRELDGLRGLAALLVVGFHSGVVNGGAIGVDLFFVLSGWLITGILLRGRPLSEFISSRVRRLIPALAAMLGVYLIAATLIPSLNGPEAPLVSALSAATYTTDLRMAAGAQGSPLQHTWSLAIETQFYLLWPFLVPMFAKCPKVAATGLVALWAVVTGARAVLYLAGHEALAYYSPLHATGLLLGAALALWPKVEAPKIAGWAGAALIAAALLLRPATNALTPYALETPLAEIGALLIIAAPPRLLAFGPMVELGVISYGIYLWQLPILHALAGFPPVLRVALAFVLSVATAAISWRFIEAPILARRRTLRHERTPETALS